MGKIRVTGKGKASVKPDTIEVELSISSLEEKYAKSLQVVDDKVASLKAELKKCGVENVKTTNFNIRQRSRRVYDKNNNYKDVFEGFETFHNLVIKFDYDTQKLGEVVAAISNSIAQPRLNINFTSNILTEAKEEAIKDGVAQAKRSALVLAEAAGVRLGEINLIDYSFSQVFVDAPRSANFECLAKTSYEGSSLKEIDVENIDINANVTIEWETL